MEGTWALKLQSGFSALNLRPLLHFPSFDFLICKAAGNTYPEATVL